MASLQNTSSGLSADQINSKAPKPILKKAKPTSFGLELEFNLSFHEAELKLILNKHKIPHNKMDDAPSLKRFSKNQHRDLLITIHDEPSHQCREQYPSWAISMPSNNNDPYFRETMNSLVQSSTQTTGLVRRYMAEPLLIAQNAIKSQHSKAQVDVCAFMRRGESIPLPNAGSDDYLRCQSANLSHWTLTNDHTLMGSLKTQLLKTLPSKIDQKNIHNWDSAGIELISPILKLAEKEEAIKTLKNYLDALRNSQNVDILKSKWAGMHTHIGLDVDTTKELDANILFFQHLAFILTSTEDVISACFSRKCSGLNIQQGNNNQEETIKANEHQYTSASETPEITSLKTQIAALEDSSEGETEAERQDRIGRQTELEMRLWDLEEPVADFQAEDLEATKTEEEKQAENEQRVLAAESSYTGYGSINSNARYLASRLHTQHPLSQEALAQAIFKQGQSFTDLINLIQSPKDPKNPEGERFRGHMYNFANLHNIALGKNAGETWKLPKPTIEFRQHECTIDATEVEYWVRFTEAIVTKAANLAAESGVAATGSDFDSGIQTQEEEKAQRQTYTATEVAKYTSLSRTNVTQFAGWLGLGQKEQEYWQARYDKNCLDRPSE